MVALIISLCTTGWPESDFQTGKNISILLYITPNRTNLLLRGVPQAISPKEMPDRIQLNLTVDLPYQVERRLPSSQSLREAKVGILEIGPLHNFLDRSSLVEFVLTELSTDLMPTGTVRY
jgi:hypothetical protein